MRELIERLMDEAMPQEKIKRGEVRPSGQVGYYPSEAAKNGLMQNDMIGWFGTSGNKFGWSVFVASPEDKKEFGSDVYRTHASGTRTVNIVKINLASGTFAFLDNEAYEDGVVKFQKAVKYKELMIENTPKAFKAFGIV